MPGNQELAERLKRGPSYLLVGQAWLKGVSGRDVFLEQAARKFNGVNAAEAGYSALLETSASANYQEAVAWLNHRCASIPMPEAFEIIGEFVWNGIATSAIDDVLIRSLRRPWRDVQRVTDRHYQPADPRSRTKLHVWCLFGNVGAAEPDGWPPLTQLQFIQRKAVATVLADVLPSLLTRLGVLCIEGYDPRSDWLTTEAVYQICANLAPGQVHLFGASEYHRNDRFLSELASKGNLTFHIEKVAQFLAEAADAGWVQCGQTAVDIAFGQSIRIAGHSVAIPEQLLRQIQTTARIITELAFAPLREQSRDARYAEFRNFLYDSSYRPDWEGYARGFAFKRPFQTRLWQTVQSQVENVSIRSEPVILHGSTGSGKTVALGQLAFDLQKEGRVPVVFIDRHVRQVHREAIDQFCNWAENQDAPAVVVIWDGMMEPKEYRGLDRYLRGRGRRSVLVGTCYQTDISAKELPNGVVASPAMASEELHQFLSFLESVDPDLPARFARLPQTEPESFLGSLYRYLPETRAAIQTGLGLEVAHVEDLLLQLRLPVDQTARFGTRLGDLLAEAGLAGSPETFGETTQTLGGEEVTEIRRLVALVMVPGQFGLSCPFELLMRAVGRTPGAEFLQTLERVDIFRISEDSDGNPVVGPRSALEARLINKRLLGGPRPEIEYAAQILEKLRTSYLTGQREIDFAVDLLRFLGPNGQNAAYYAPHFERLAQSLSDLRAETGLRNTRLLLQESVLLRESAKLRPAESPDESQTLLHRAIVASTEAIEATDNRPATRSIRCQLLVEKAAALGALAQTETDSRARLRSVEEAHENAFRAYAVDPTSFHPLDVIAWTASNLLTSTALSEGERLRIIESVTHAFSLAESEDWDVEAQVQLEKRKMELGRVFGAQVADQAFQNLLNLGSAAGVVFRAFQLAGGTEGKRESYERRKQLASKALEFMDAYPEVVLKDPRALFLRFKLWWRTRAGIDFNERERFPVPFGEADWDECVQTIGGILTHDEFRTNLTLRLIEAVAFFHRGEYSRGFEAFEQLNAEQIYARNRIVRRYLFSDSAGKPRRFSGTVVTVRDSRTGFVSISGFPRRILFFLYETGRPDTRQGDDLSDFHIAFNMLGPIADFRVSE